MNDENLQRIIGMEVQMGVYKHGVCAICNDHMTPEGKCCYCEWDSRTSPEETCKQYNNYWHNGRDDSDRYKRPLKTPKDF